MKNIIKHLTLIVLVSAAALNSVAQVNWGKQNTFSPEQNTFSSALGDKNQLVGLFSTAIGYNNQAKDNNTNSSTFNFSFATGVNNAVNGHYSFAFGNDNVISDQKSMAFGFSNKILKNSSFVIGGDNEIENGVSVAIGYKIKNTARNGITIGYGYNTSNKRLLNNTDGIMMGMNSDKPTFFISSSFCDGRTGRVGIGNVTDPQAKLHIKADNYSYDGEDADILLEPTRANKIAVIYFKDKNNSIAVSGSQMTFTAPKYSFTNAGITLGKNTATQSPDVSFASQGGGISVGTDRVMSFATGKVGIGCENNIEGYALAVKGGVVSTRVSVMDVDEWPDYVFGKDYERMSLYELEEYIGLNHHLPEVPSAEEVSEQGIDLGEMNAILLQKVEELTLHVIELQKQIDAQQNKIDLQQNEINELKSR